MRILGSLLVVGSVVASGATPAGAKLHLRSFQTPSHNIGCIIGGLTARCDIAHRTWSPPPQPASCPKITGWGQGLWIVGGKATFTCAGDTALDPSFKVARYGSTVKEGRYSCKITTAGVTCHSIHTGHGFFISKDSYRFF